MKSIKTSLKTIRPIRRWAAVVIGVLALSVILGPVQATEEGAPIRFALTTPLSPPGDVRSGQAIQRAAQVWLEHIHSTGGINGRPVKIKTFDTAGKPSVGVQVARRAIVNYGASALVGVWASSVALAEARIAHRYNVPMLTFFSWSDKVTAKNYPQVFRIGPFNTQIAAGMLQFVKHKGYDRVALLAEDTAYGAGFAERFKEAIKGSGIELKTVVYPARAKDLTAELSEIKQFNPDALIIEAVYAAKNLVIEQAAQLGIDAQIIAGWDWPTLPGFWDTVGKAGKGIIYASFNPPHQKLTPVGKRFLSRYREAYGQKPAGFLYFFIDTLNALKVAIQKADTAKPAKLVKVLPTISFMGTTGHVEFSHKKGTVYFNSWTDVRMYFKKLTEVGQAGKDAKLIYTAH